MYKKIIEEMKHYPAVYESTGLAFWDDEHISGSMLDNHLAPEADGASRRHKFIEQSAEWIAGIGTTGRKLLDLGCGPGIYAELLAAKGYEVTGMDFSRRSIAYAAESARQKGLNIKYHYQDYLTMEAEHEYDGVVMIYCDFGVLPPDSRRILLDKIYRALKPGGFFLLDVFTPHQYQTFTDTEQVSFEDGGFWSPEPYVCIKKDRAYENSTFLEQYIIITETESNTYNLWNHAFTQAELLGSLQQRGFKETRFYQDVAGAEYDEAGVTMCAVSRKQTQR